MDRVKTGATVRVTIPQWLRDSSGLMSRELEGEVLRTSHKAAQVRAHAVIREARRCLRCGCTIINPMSILVGYGPECCGYLGIPRPTQLDPASIDEIRASVSRASAVTLWLPFSRCEFATLQEAEVTQRKPQEKPQDALISVQTGSIRIKALYEHKDRCKAVAGARWNRAEKVWTYPNTPSTIAAILEQFGKGDLNVTIPQGFAAAADALAAAQAHKTAEALPDVPSKTRAWLHQQQAYHFAKDLPAAMLAMDMGTGKSKVVVDIVANRHYKKVLIICPKTVLRVWPAEFEVHAQPAVAVTVLNPKRSVAKKTEQAKVAPDGVIVINHESAWREPFATWALAQQWDLAVIDESHRGKAPGGKFALFTARLRDRAAQRFCLTGTPMPHSPLDAYAQYRFLDPGIFGSNFTKFRSRYAVMGGYGGYEVLGYQRQDELNQRLFSIGYRATKDVLDLPESLHIDRHCTLSPAARRVYTQLESDFYTEVKGGRITPTNALVKLLRLQQLTSGYSVTDDGDEVQLGGEKGELLADTLEDLAVKEPVVVFARFRHDLDTIRKVAEKQGRSYAELSGRRNELAEWQAGRYDVIGVQIQAGGVGVSLVRARYCIYYSVGYSLGDYEQSLARVHRPGQSRPVVYIHLIAAHTVDEEVMWALQNKKDVVASILERADTERTGAD